MSLEEPTTKPQEKKSKKQQARDLALQYKTLAYHTARAKIMEEIPCSRSTATKALKWMEKQQKEEKIAKPSLKVAEEAEKKPEFMEKPEEISPLEEIAATKIEEITPEEAEEQLEIFRDMLRGFHVIVFAEGGLIDLLLKAGVKEKQAKDVSDQLYRWLTRRYSVEDLEKWDTILLVASYGTLVGSIVKKVIENRGKKK